MLNCDVYGFQRGFPFDEEEGGADPWNDLATRHPDIAARLRQHQHQHPATWARKRRPSSQDAEGKSSNSSLLGIFQQKCFECNTTQSANRTF